MFEGRIYLRVRSGFVVRLVFAAALALTAFAQDACADEIRFERSTLTVATARGEHRFRVELALEPAQRERGLQHRPFLAEDAGMLFVFDQPGAVDMWMLNTLIPLDMMFIAADGRIVNIAERTRPKSLDIIPSAGPVLAVLEVLGGTSARLGIRPGDRVVHPLLTRR